MKTALERIEDLARITAMARGRAALRGNWPAMRLLTAQERAYNDAATLIRAEAGERIDRSDDPGFERAVTALMDEIRSTSPGISQAAGESLLAEEIADTLCGQQGGGR